MSRRPTTTTTTTTPRSYNAPLFSYDRRDNNVSVGTSKDPVVRVFSTIRTSTREQVGYKRPARGSNRYSVQRLEFRRLPACTSPSSTVISSRANIRIIHVNTYTRSVRKTDRTYSGPSAYGVSNLRVHPLIRIHVNIYIGIPTCTYELTNERTDGRTCNRFVVRPFVRLLVSSLKIRRPRGRCHPDPHGPL